MILNRSPAAPPQALHQPPRGAVGLAPKRYCRVLRFRRALSRLSADPRLELSTLAQEALDWSCRCTASLP